MTPTGKSGVTAALKSLLPSSAQLNAVYFPATFFTIITLVPVFSWGVRCLSGPSMLMRSSCAAQNLPSRCQVWQSGKLDTGQAYVNTSRQCHGHTPALS